MIIFLLQLNKVTFQEKPSKCILFLHIMEIVYEGGGGEEGYLEGGGGTGG